MESTESVSDPTAARVEYAAGMLTRSDLVSDPVEQLRRWLLDAAEAGDDEPNAMALATVDGDGRPRCRNVLLRDLDEGGLVFFTNRNSAKGRALDTNPVASVLFSWLGMHRQARVDAEVELIDDATADAYWDSRPRMSQLASAASPQGEVVANREALKALMQQAAEATAGGAIERPDHWVGYRLVPHTFEFWQGRRARLHDRFRYRLIGGAWVIDRLAP